MFGTHLNLNKRRTRKDVISKLQKLGYEISDNANAQEIRTVVRELQLKNGLIPDGYIGDRTKPLLNGDIVKHRDMYGIYRDNGIVEEIKSAAKKTKTNNIPLNCVNCGAPLHSHRCEYCDTDYSNYDAQEELKIEPSDLYNLNINGLYDTDVSGMIFNKTRGMRYDII